MDFYSAAYNAILIPVFSKSLHSIVYNQKGITDMMEFHRLNISECWNLRVHACSCQIWGWVYHTIDGKIQINRLKIYFLLSTKHCFRPSWYKIKNTDSFLEEAQSMAHLIIGWKTQTGILTLPCQETSLTLSVLVPSGPVETLSFPLSIFRRQKQPTPALAKIPIT